MLVYYLTITLTRWNEENNVSLKSRSENREDYNESAKYGARK